MLRRRRPPGKGRRFSWRVARGEGAKPARSSAAADPGLLPVLMLWSLPKRRAIPACYSRLMTAGIDMAATAALVGDPGRANMLGAMLDGRAHPPTELANLAGVTRATASGH